jgi:hypothetical protein
MGNKAKLKMLEARLAWHRGKYNYRKRKMEGWQQSEKRGEYWLDQHRKKHNAKGAESANASIIRARAGVYKWGKLVSEEAKEINKLKPAIAKLKPKPVKKAEGFSTPRARWNPSERPIANWIIPELEWAAAHGWTGYVTSGYRSYQKQKELYELYQRGGNIAARPGQSNHEGYEFPKGAVDVTNYNQFNAVLSKKPGHKLRWGIVIADYVHFSGTGR